MTEQELVTELENQYDEIIGPRTVSETPWANGFSVSGILEYKEYFCIETIGKRINHTVVRYGLLTIDSVTTAHYYGQKPELKLAKLTKGTENDILDYAESNIANFVAVTKVRHRHLTGANKWLEFDVSIDNTDNTVSQVPYIGTMDAGDVITLYEIV